MSGSENGAGGTLNTRASSRPSASRTAGSNGSSNSISGKSAGPYARVPPVSGVTCGSAPRRIAAIVMTESTAKMVSSRVSSPKKVPGP